MLEAKKNRWFSKIFKLYNRNLLKRRFNSFQIDGLNKLQSAFADRPIILYANHSSWWDGLVVFEILSRTDLNPYFLMETEQLKRFYFFRYLGAFGIDRQIFRDGYLGVKYAARILKENSQNLLVIFPQGKILPNDHSLNFFGGLSRIVRDVENCCVFPIALQFEFLQNYKPEIFVAVADPLVFQESSEFNLRLQTRAFAERLNDLLQNQKLLIAQSRTETYSDLFNL